MTIVREFFAWWFGRLAELLPQGLRRSALTAVDAMVIKPIGPLSRGIEAVSVSLRRNGRETPLGRFGLGATNLAELPRVAGRTTVLRLDGPDVLGKTVTLPLAAERELDQVLGFEMDRETPFKAEEIYWNHRIEKVDRQSGRLTVRLVVVPKSNLAPLLTALVQSEIRPRRVEIAGGPDVGAYLPLDGDGSRAHHPSNRLMWSAAACCAILGLAAVVIPFIRQELALASLERQIAVGRTAAAARLIGPLAADGAFRNPGFAAPVTRVEALHTELFTINAEVTP